MSTPPNSPSYLLSESFSTPLSSYSDVSSPSSGYFSSPLSDASNESSTSTLTNCSQEEYDQVNAKLFAKFLPNELHDPAALFSHFRRFGEIRMLSLNTKRHVALIEYSARVYEFRIPI